MVFNSYFNLRAKLDYFEGYTTEQIYSIKEISYIYVINNYQENFL